MNQPTHQNQSNRPSYNNNRRPQQNRRPQEEQYVSPTMTSLALKMVLNFYLYAESKNYPVMHYVKYDGYVLAAMVGSKYLPKDFQRQVSSVLNEMGYTLLRFDKGSYILIRTEHVNRRWTKLGHSRVSKRPNDYSVLTAEIDRIKGVLAERMPTQITAAASAADSKEQEQEISENLSTIMDGMRVDMEALEKLVSARDTEIEALKAQVVSRDAQIAELREQLAAR